MTDQKKPGVEVRRQVMGDAFVDRALGNATEFSQPLQDFVNDHAWGSVWNREGLPLKTRSLITLAEDPIVSQPGPLSNGETAVVPRSRLNAQQEAKPMFKFGPGTTLDEIVRAVNQVGAAPGDLMAILEALKQAGALQADLIVI